MITVVEVVEGWGIHYYIDWEFVVDEDLDEVENLGD